MHSTPSLLMRQNERLTFSTFICSVLAIVSLTLTALHAYVGVALILTSFVVHALVMLLRGYLIAGRCPQTFLGAHAHRNVGLIAACTIRIESMSAQGLQ